MARMGALLIALAAVASLGCPGDDMSGAGGGASDGQGAAGQGAGGGETNAARLCGAHLSWDMGCAAMEPEPRVEPYWGETECLDGHWSLVQTPYIDAAVDCFATLSCDSSDDACTAAGLAALGIHDESDVEGDADYQRCLERAHECQVLDDLCLGLLVFTEAGRRAAIACLDLECTAVADCLRDPA